MSNGIRTYRYIHPVQKELIMFVAGHSGMLRHPEQKGGILRGATGPPVVNTGNQIVGRRVTFGAL